MDLRQLRYFTTVAAERSFSRAAEKLSIAQPPLSRQVQQLEQELGVRLLDRGRPLTLTAPGRYLFENGSELLRRLDDICSMTRKLGQEHHQRFRIGFVASTLYDRLPELLRRFRRATPGIEVTLTELTTVEQVTSLRDGGIDVAFGRLHFDDESVSREVISEDRLVLALPRRHRLAQASGALGLRDVVAEPLILDLRSPRPSYADLVLGYFRERSLTPNLILEVRDLQTALGLVAAEAGISITPGSARRIVRDDVVFRSLDEPGLVAPIILSHRKGDQSLQLANMKTLIREFDQWVEPA